MIYVSINSPLLSGVLVPLFGLHNFLSAFKPDDDDSVARIIIEIISALTISFQVRKKKEIFKERDGRPDVLKKDIFLFLDQFD